jgi:peptidoglycan/LPS O-acetylase OafA/YrhL
MHIFTLLLFVWLSKDHPVDSEYISSFLKNILLSMSYTEIGEVKFNAVSWSLSDEMFFYLLFPFIVAWMGKSKQSLVICFSLLLVAVLALPFLLEDNKSSEWLLYASPYTRIADFGIGILLFNICRYVSLDKWRKYISPTMLELSAVVLLVAFYYTAFYVPQIYRHAVWYWIPVGFLIFVFYHQSGVISHFLSKRIWVLLGEISFSFYMLHGFVKHYVLRITNDYLHLDIPAFVMFIVIAVSCIIASYLTFRYIEKPSNRLIKQLFKERSPNIAES